MTAAEHLEAAIWKLGWDCGPCVFEVVAVDGQVRKVYPRPTAIGRDRLDQNDQAA